MIEPVTLATSVAAVVTALFKKAAEKVGEGAAGTLIDALKKKLHHSQAHRALEELGKEPADPDREELLRVHLKLALKENRDLLAELERWLSEAEKETNRGAHIEQHATATQGSTVVQIGQGSHNSVNIGKG
jgi:hypothetical protein